VKEFVTAFSAYVMAVFIQSQRWLLTLFSVLGVVFFFYPNLAKYVSDTPGLIKAIGGLIVLISFALANFLAYYELYLRTIKKPADISMIVKNTEITWTSWGGHTPHSPILFRIEMDVRNEGDEQAKITTATVCEFALNSSLFSNKPVATDWFQLIAGTNMSGSRIDFPYLISAREWHTAFRCSISVNIEPVSAEELSKQLTELRSYYAKICYTVKDFDGKTKEKTISITGDFEPFRKKIIRQWQQSGQYQYVFNAIDLDKILE